MAKSSVKQVSSPDQPSVSVLIDNLTATLPLHQKATLLDLIGAEGWEQLPYGRRGYTHGMIRGSVQVFYGGDACRNKQGDETLHLIIHGSGCRELEGDGVIHVGKADKDTWETFVSFLLDLGGRIKRLDFAIDDHTGTLLPKMVEAVKQGHYTSHFQKIKRFNVYHLDQEVTEGMTFGGRASNAFLRVYDKALEQRQKNREYDGECTRVELELKGVKAHAAAVRIAASSSLAFLPGLMRSLLDIKEPSGNQQKARWPSVHWWSSFLGHCAKVRLTVNPIKRTIEQVEEWIKRQVAPNLALLFTHYGGEWERLERLMNNGRSRWKKRHRDLVNSFSNSLEPSERAVTT